MTHVEEMLQTHPKKSSLDPHGRAQAIAVVFDCVQACTSCADACLNEKAVDALRRCIASNTDCADVCMTTARILSRQTTPSWALLRAQLQACVTACRVCGDECEQHSAKHEHCAVCATACRACEQACKQLLASLPQA